MPAPEAFHAMTTPLRVRGACPHDCPDTCGIVTEVEDGRAVGFSGDLDHPITKGWLCAKVRPYLDHVYHPDRVLHPLRRVGPKGGGRWTRITWDEALDEIGRRWKDIIARHGAEAILPYSYSGTLGLVQMSVSMPASGTGSAPVSCNAASAGPPPSSPSRPRSANAGVRPTPTWFTASW